MGRPVFLQALILSQDCKLISLDLSRNQFGDKGGQILGPAVSTNVYLDSLNLSWNQIRCSGAVAIAKGLKVIIHYSLCSEANVI